MNFIYIFLFLIFLSCNTTNKEFVCGDHPCIDKREFNEYFSKNLTVEIKSQDNKKNKSIDLVKLNTDTRNIEKNINKESKKDERIRRKNEKEKLKIEKIRLKNERNIKAENEKKQSKLAKITKSSEKINKRVQNEINNNRESGSKILDQTNDNKKPLVKAIKKNVSIDASKSKTKSICDGIKDCDIDKIAELLIKKGKSKPFPNISSK